MCIRDRDSKRPVRYFEYQPGRGGKYPETFLKGYTGYIHTDAYSGYNGVKGVTRCLCYTHLRRAFVDALPKDIQDVYKRQVFCHPTPLKLPLKMRKLPGGKAQICYAGCPCFLNNFFLHIRKTYATSQN